MKRILILGCALLVVCAAISYAADPVEGYWISVDEKENRITGGWHIYQEGGKLYGRVLSVADKPQDAIAAACRDFYQGFPLPGKVSEMLVCGTPWIFGLTMDRIGRWSGGSIIDPTDGKMYKCRIIHHPQDGNRYKVETLEMRGEIGLGIGRSQYWRRSNEEEAASLR